MKTWFLKLHRWLALLFSLPLAIVIVTGLILSFEPWLVTRAIAPGSLSVEKVHSLLKQHDPQGRARAITHRSYDHTLAFSAGRGGGTLIDIATGEVRQPSALADLIVTTRRLHETLLLDARWLVVTTTSVMMAIIVLGILMGWPRFASTVPGWHKATAWGLLPLIVLSPLTALLMAAGITLAPAPAGRAPSGDMALAHAVSILGKDHDLSALVWVRSQRGQMLGRLVENGEYRVYAVTPDGATPMGRNWPRLWHEGNFAGGWSALMNLVISVAMTGLLVTGVWIWLRRGLRRRRRATRPIPVGPPA